LQPFFFCHSVSFLAVLSAATAHRMYQGGINLSIGAVAAGNGALGLESH
jgi:ribose/xylose/arabinose/galactoside ABC-type transport system permease subunit